MKQIPFYILALFGIILIWAFISWVLFEIRGSAILPYPWETVTAGISRIGELGSAFAASARRFLISLLLSFALGVPLGLAIGGSKRLDRLLSPLVYLIYPVPPIALLVFLYLAFGVGEAVKIVVVTTALFFQVLVAAMGAVRNLPQSYILSVRSTGASALDLHRHVILPGVLPDVLTAARVAVGLGITMLYIAETRLGVLGGPGSGLGIFVEYYTFRPALSLAGIVGLALLGLAFYALLEVIERFLCRWRYVGGTSGG
jgi:NitT/TauT family transport system permease protein